MGVVTEQLNVVAVSGLARVRRGCGVVDSLLCWEAAVAEKGKLNTLPGAQALSSSFAFMVPKTSSAAEILSFRQREQEKAGKMACYFHSEVFQPMETSRTSMDTTIVVYFYTSEN